MSERISACRVGSLDRAERTGEAESMSTTPALDPEVAAALAVLVAALQKPATAPEPEPGVQKMLTTEEAAEVLRCSVSHVYGLSREGRLPSVRVGRRRLYPAAGVDEFLAAGGAA